MSYYYRLQRGLLLPGRRLSISDCDLWRVGLFTSQPKHDVLQRVQKWKMCINVQCVSVPLACVSLSGVCICVYALSAFSGLAGLPLFVIFVIFAISIPVLIHHHICLLVLCGCTHKPYKVKILNQSGRVIFIGGFVFMNAGTEPEYKW